MKTAIKSHLINLVLCLALPVVSLAQVTKFSQEPQSTASLPGDNILWNHTNSGAGTFTTQRMPLGVLLSSGIALSNASATALWIRPTNFYTPSGTLTVSLGLHLWTATGGIFVNAHPGDNFVVNGTDQYNIIEVENATQVYTFEPANLTYSATACSFYYPNAANITDINGNRCGWIGSDGAFGTIGVLGNVANSAKFFWGNGLYSMAAVMQRAFDGTRWSLGSVSNQNILNVYDSAPYDTLDLDSDGTVSVKGGITNRFGNSKLCGPNTDVVGLMSVSNLASGIKIDAARSISSAGTVSGTIGTFAVTGSAGLFTGIYPGTVIQIGVQQFTIVAIASPTACTVFEPLDQTYSAAACNLIFPIATYRNTSPNPSGFVAPDGTVGMIAIGTSGNNGRLMAANGSHGFVAVPRLQGGTLGWRWEFGSQQGAGAGIFNICDAAPYDSLDIGENGWVTFRQGITNIFGTLNIGGNVSLPATLTAGTVVGNINGNISQSTNSVRKVSASTTALATDEIILLNAASLTLTLPTAVGIVGKTYEIMSISTTPGSTVATTGGQTINGAASATISAQYKGIKVVSDNANWFIIGNY